jgi:hypothetical protein
MSWTTDIGIAMFFRRAQEAACIAWILIELKMMRRVPFPLEHVFFMPLVG